MARSNYLADLFRFSLVFILAMYFQSCVYAQTYQKLNAGTLTVGANTAIDSKAVLDARSTTKGALIPRMTTAQRDAITSPTTGLLLYNSSTNFLNVFNGSFWLETATLTGSETLTNKSISGLTNTLTNITANTNANLTGPITSSGNATAVASQTGTGSVFVMQATPTLTTPVIGAATGTSLSVSGQLTSTVSTGTAPLVVSSTTEVNNLRAATAVAATNLSGGTGGTVPYQSAADTTVLLANGVTGQVLRSNGGTAAPTWMTPTFDAISPMTTSGDVIYGGASGTGTRLARGTDGQVLVLASGIPSWGTVLTNPMTTLGDIIVGGASGAPTRSVLLPLAVQRLISGTTYNLNYYFIVTSASATLNATYTNNSVTFTVNNTISAGTLLIASGNSAPASSGTLTKASGTGDSTITFASFRTPVYLKVRMVGGGGGGGGSHGSGGAGGTGGAGGNTTFGSSLLTANGGGGAAQSGGVGGATTVSSPALSVISNTGGRGATGSSQYVLGGSGNGYAIGGSGANSLFGGAGQAIMSGAGAAAGSNTGSGGGGGSVAAGNGIQNAGGGGASGGYIEAIILTPSSTYAYAIGAAGAGGIAGTGGTTGADGGAGIIIVEAYGQ